MKIKLEVIHHIWRRFKVYR